MTDCGEVPPFLTKGTAMNSASTVVRSLDHPPMVSWLVNQVLGGWSPIEIICGFL